MSAGGARTAGSDFASQAELGVVRYSQVWEDHRLLERGLEVTTSDDVLSIGSAGCNVLALLLREPRRIVAVDVSPAQAALIELKLAAIRLLDHGRLATFLGVGEANDRLAEYAGLRDALSPAARDFWDGESHAVQDGVLGCGMLERYFRDFQERHLNRLLAPGTVARLVEQALASPELEAAFRSHFSREAMNGRARDASQFRYVEEDDLAGFWWERFRHVCTAIPAAGNHYLEWFLTSRYADLAAGPPYLRPGNADRLRPLLDRVEVVVDDLSAYLEAQAPGTFSKANLSDIFEYMSAEASERLLELVASRMRPGGRIAYWNLLVSRARPSSLSTVLEPRSREAQDLWAEDRVFFYRAFHVDEVIG
ncbi:MAG: DUF3419 family protein [Gaiellaceae bacterium]